MTVAQSTTVNPAICACSRWRSSIQVAGRPNAGSVVAVPSSGTVAPPGLIASHMVADDAGGTAKVTIADVVQSNGVIHVVDKVLLPK